MARSPRLVFADDDRGPAQEGGGGVGQGVPRSRAGASEGVCWGGIGKPYARIGQLLMERSFSTKVFGALSLLSRIGYHLRGRAYRCLILAAGGKCGRGLRVERGFRLRHGAHKGLEFGRNLYIGASSVLDCPAGASLAIGDDVTLTHGVFIGAAHSVILGSDVLVGEYSSIRDADHGIECMDTPIRLQPMRPKGVVVGQDVWIGRGCAILSGTTIGNGAVIGANSVVKGQFAAHVVAVGCPARVIRTRVGPAG